MTIFYFNTKKKILAFGSKLYLAENFKMELIAIVVGLILLLKGGDWLMKSAVAISLGLNISRFVIGMTVVSFATSAPELIVSIQAAVSGFPDLAFGNVIGSNIASLAFVLAIIIMISPIISLFIFTTLANSIHFSCTMGTHARNPTVIFICWTSASSIPD